MAQSLAPAPEYALVQPVRLAAKNKDTMLPLSSLELALLDQSQPCSLQEGALRQGLVPHYPLAHEPAHGIKPAWIISSKR